MAKINYSPVGWDTTKFVNPTNMNQMDEGIKAACDGVDAANENLTTYTSIPINDLFSELNVTVTSSEIYKKANHIYGYIKCSGSATSSMSGTIQIGTLANNYRPKARQVNGAYYNPDTGGQWFAPSSTYIGTSGYVGMYIGESNKTCGSASYPWCTTDGFVFGYEL